MLARYRLSPELVLLSFLLIASNLFWAIISLKLVNRLMSRSYVEYVQAEELKTPRPIRAEVDSGMHVDPMDHRQAQDMNSLLGVNF